MQLLVLEGEIPPPPSPAYNWVGGLDPLRLSLQGYLAHKKQLPPLEPPQGLRHSPFVGS